MHLNNGINPAVLDFPNFLLAFTTLLFILYFIQPTRAHLVFDGGQSLFYNSSAIPIPDHHFDKSCTGNCCMSFFIFCGFKRVLKIVELKEKRRKKNREIGNVDQN